MLSRSPTGTGTTHVDAIPVDRPPPLTLAVYLASMSSSPRCARWPRTTSRTAPKWRVASVIGDDRQTAALRAMKNICEREWSPRFRRAMSRHSGAIRSCVNHHALKSPTGRSQGRRSAPRRPRDGIPSRRRRLLRRLPPPPRRPSLRTRRLTASRVYASTTLRSPPFPSSATRPTARQDSTRPRARGAARPNVWIRPEPSVRRPRTLASPPPRRVSRVRVPRPRDPRDPRDSRRAVAASPLDRLALAALTDAGASERRHRRAFRARRFGGTASGGRGVRSRRRETRAPGGRLGRVHTRVRRTQRRGTRARAREHAPQGDRAGRDVAGRVQGCVLRRGGGGRGRCGRRIG